METGLAKMLKRPLYAIVFIDLNGRARHTVCFASRIQQQKVDFNPISLHTLRWPNVNHHPLLKMAFQRVVILAVHLEAITKIVNMPS